MKKIFIASDHAGFECKKQVTDFFRNHQDLKAKFELIDLGPDSTLSVDYPDFADLVCKQVLENNSLGILICGSGQGMAMRANKYQNIRAALCWNEESAKLSREHNDANVLCFGARMLSMEVIEAILVTFFNTHFAGDRHQKRVQKLSSTPRF